MVTHKQIREIVRDLSNITTYGWMDESKFSAGQYNLDSRLYNIGFYHPGGWSQRLVDMIAGEVKSIGYTGNIKVTGDGMYLRFYRVGV